MKLFGIPIKFEISFFVITLFLGFGRSSTPVLMIEWVLVVFFSVLIHEFGHALTIKAFGLAPSIKLHGMGGLTSWTDSRGLSPVRRIAVSVAGPVAGFLFGGLCLLFKPWLYNPTQSLLLVQTYRDLLWVNIGWGVINLLPILPMD